MTRVTAICSVLLVTPTVFALKDMKNVLRPTTLYRNLRGHHTAKGDYPVSQEGGLRYGQVMPDGISGVLDQRYGSGFGVPVPLMVFW